MCDLGSIIPPIRPLSCPVMGVTPGNIQWLLFAVPACPHHKARVACFITCRPSFSYVIIPHHTLSYRVCVFFTLNRSSTRRHPAHPVSVLILHPRKISSVVTSYDTEIMHRNACGAFKSWASVTRFYTLILMWKHPPLLRKPQLLALRRVQR